MQPLDQFVHESYSWVRQILFRIDQIWSKKFEFGASFWSVCTRIPFLSPPNSVQNRSNLIKNVRFWRFFLSSLYTNIIPESAKNRISNCSDETLKTQFLRAWRPKPGQMSNTEELDFEAQEHYSSPDAKLILFYILVSAQKTLFFELPNFPLVF